MSRRVTIRKPEPPIDVEVELPRSKSIANRALIIASLAGDLSCVRQRGDADDTRILHDLLAERPRVMHCGLGGTTFRFLLAWASVQEGEEHLITGEPRLLERPHAPLVEALQHLGADITQVGEGFRVRGKKLEGGDISIDSPISSQFISALMLVAPRMEDGMFLRWTGRRLSEPYVRMTAHCLAHFGALVDTDGDVIPIAPAPLRPTPFTVPPDWSAASFWYEIVALSPDARVVLSGLRDAAWQGDAAAQQLWSWAVRTTQHANGVELTRNEEPTNLPKTFELSDTPDLLQPLAATLACRGKSSAIVVPGTVRLKESDRLASTAEALRSLGFEVEVTANLFVVKGRLNATDAPPLNPHNDHRLAMCLAPMALLCDAVTIMDADVVNKSYPGFWDDVAKAGFRLTWGE